jgi:hypothetical protein
MSGGIKKVVSKKTILADARTLASFTKQQRGQATKNTRIFSHDFSKITIIFW